MQDRINGRRSRGSQLLGAARKQVVTLDREAQADAAFGLLGVEQAVADTYVEYSTRLRELAQAYAGTTAAAVAEVQLLVDPREPARTAAALDAVVARNPGTALAAMAVYMKGSQIANRTFDFVKNQRAADHAERLEQVVAIVRELESGRYPRSYWARHAPDLVFTVNMVDVRLLDGRLTPADAQRALAAYGDFLATHWALLDDEDQSPRFRHLMSGIMPALARQASASETAVDDLFASLETRGLPRDSRRWLEALHYLLPDKSRPPDAEARALERARNLLAEAANAAGGDLARDALVTLAAHELRHERFDAARRHYMTYLERYASSEWAWVAALRVAQLDDAVDRMRRRALAVRQVGAGSVTACS